MKLAMIGPPSYPLHRGDIVWDRRKDFWNMVADRVEGRRFGKKVIVGTDGRTLPLEYAQHDRERKEVETEKRERAELARLKAKYESPCEGHEK